MTLTTLAIQTEACLQEELGAQRLLLSALERTEQAARAGASAELEPCGRELEALVAQSAARGARRRALLGKLGGALALRPEKVTLTRLSERLAAEQLDTARLAALRTELREVVARVVRVGRRLASVAAYHRGLMDELIQRLAPAEAAGSGALRVDAEA